MFKKGILFGILGLLTLTSLGHAQVPDAFSYQAVVRSNDKELLKNQTISVKVSIIGNDVVIFTQTQTATTNENGLLTLNLGNEEFQEINWLDGPLFIKTEIDPTGGNNFTIETETQLLAVPYAMAAKTAETALNVPELDLLIERVNYLETQVEELMEYVYGNEPEYPIEVPFEAHTFETPSCWVYDNTSCHDYFDGGGEVVFVNSYEELENYMVCSTSYGFPEVDFSANTLLVMCGSVVHTPGAVASIEFLKISSNEFLLNLDVLNGWLTSPGFWILGIIVEKLPENTIVELKVTMYEFWEY